jgi:hypothetical protein
MRRKEFSDVWEFIQKGHEDVCWIWTGLKTSSKSTHRYGAIGINGKSYLAHRIVYALTYPGSISPRAPNDRAKKEFVLHRCDEPLCCNPNHLFLGNYADNNKDAKNKGRSNCRKREQHNLAKLNEKQVAAIRVLYRYGHCRAEMARRLNVSWSCINLIVKNKNWKIPSIEGSA